MAQPHSASVYNFALNLVLVEPPAAFLRGPYLNTLPPVHDKKGTQR
jgi:hypothetical protein